MYNLASVTWCQKSGSMKWLKLTRLSRNQAKKGTFDKSRRIIMEVTIPVMNWKASDLHMEWIQFEKQIKLLFKGPLKHDTPTEHSSYIKTWITESGREILKSINPPNEERDCPYELPKVLGKYCESMRSSLYTRFIFQELKQ